MSDLSVSVTSAISIPASSSNSASVTTPVVLPSSTFLHQLTNKWKLDPSLSDSMEAMFEFMGVPWLIRKAILTAPPPSVTIEANDERLRVEQHGMANLVNEYRWNDTTHTHKVPNGAYPATLEVLNDGTMIRLQVLSMEKGRNIILQYSLEMLPGGKDKLPSLHLVTVITFWIDGKEKRSIRRVFYPKS